MGGSGIAGDYGSALASRSSGRVSVHKGYGPVPGWAIRSRPTVLAVSYSGNTEETLDFAGAAGAAGLPVVAVTTGGALSESALSEGWPMVEVPVGHQPRAAIGYLGGAVARLLASLGLLDDQAEALDEAATLADAAATEGSGPWEQAAELAGSLAGRISIIYGGGPISSTVAQRWKTQINENAKMPAWWSVLPELDHNELVGWEALPSLTLPSVGVVVLTDRSDHPRVRARIEHSSELTSFAVPWLGEVAARGDSEMARLISLTVSGDLVSWMLAEGAGVDPVPVATIEKLKKLLVKD
jgi:glucose/mannose-6-phosphate isomerase